MSQKKQKWPKLPRFLIPLFHSANVYLCLSREEWNQACACLGVPPGDIGVLQGAATCFRNEAHGENLYLVGVFNHDAGTLVHECAHVTFYTCRDVGVLINPDEANETYCYLLDRMFSHFLPYITAEKS